MKKAIVVVRVTLPLLAFVAFCVWMLQRHTVIPHSLKLADCTNSTIECHLRLPKGRSYYLVLATPETGMVLKPLYSFSGDVHITTATTSLIHFPIGSEMTHQCNWLERAGIPYSFILTGPWNTNCPLLDRLLYATTNYNIRIVFKESPPPTTSIWLHWLQAGKDKEG
jgi:hypothetical protein